MILEKTVELVKQIFKIHRIMPPRVNRIIIGKSYTAVELASYFYGMVLGLAYNLKNVKEEIIRKKDISEYLNERSLDKLLSWSYESISIKKTIGIATLNALSQNALFFMNPYRKIKEDLHSYLKIDKETRVTFIGLIRPMINMFSILTKSITIIDDSKEFSKEFNQFNTKKHISQLKEEELQADVLICTGTAMLNDSLEDILKKFRKYVHNFVVIGPSASMIPDILFDYGVDIVGGMTIKDSEATIEVIQEGGGTQLFKQFGKKYSLTRNQ